MKRKVDWMHVVWKSMWVSLGTLIVLAVPEVALAVNATPLPWEGPMCDLANGLGGKTAIGIATIAFFAAAAGFIFGEQLSGIMKTMVNVVCAVAIMCAAPSMVKFISPNSISC